jgi:pyruvate/2-oxoacid:ferredoxin oxidoreductase alpha subunit
LKSEGGWIQLYSETVQESYDNMLQALIIAENPKVQTPIMVCFDAFETTHTLSNIQIEDDKQVIEFQSSIDDQNYKKPDDIATDYIIVGRALYNSENIENDILKYI